jgi:hypothetical protein
MADYKHDDVDSMTNELLAVVANANQLLADLREAGVYVNMEVKSQQILIEHITQKIEYYHAKHHYNR